MTEILDGKKLAQERLARVRERVQQLAQPVQLLSFWFQEDSGSALYTRKKAETAASVGINFQAHTCSLTEDNTKLIERIKETIASFTGGVMIQKPTRATFAAAGYNPDDFDEWWRRLVSLIPSDQDVDGLSPVTQDLLVHGQKVAVLPATVKAVLIALEKFDLKQKKILILGKSDLLGRPLAGYWQSLGLAVTLWEESDFQKSLETPEKLTSFDVIVSATGSKGIIRGDLIQPGSLIVDVGEPDADVDRASVEGKAAFLTPVPGGIGPLTIASLMENSLILGEFDGEL